MANAHVGANQAQPDVVEDEFLSPTVEMLEAASTFFTARSCSGADEPGPDAFVVNFEDDPGKIESRAFALRQHINPLTIGRAHSRLWESGKRYKQEAVPRVSARDDLPPAPWTDSLEPNALKIGAISADALCQYRAFARAIFGQDQSFHEQLRELAADFLWCNRDLYREMVNRTELARLASIRESLTENGIETCDFEAWCRALKLGLIWGQQYTLEAMCKVSKRVQTCAS